MWSNGVAKNKEIDEEQDEDCVEKGSDFLEGNLIELAREAVKL